MNGSRETYKYSASMVFLVDRQQYSNLLQGDREEISKLLYRAADLCTTNPTFSLSHIQAWDDVVRNKETALKIARKQVFDVFKTFVAGVVIGLFVMAWISSLYYSS